MPSTVQLRSYTDEAVEPQTAAIVARGLTGGPIYLHKDACSQSLSSCSITQLQLLAWEGHARTTHIVPSLFLS